MKRLRKTLIGILAVAFLAISARAQEADYSAPSQDQYGPNLKVKVWVDKGDNPVYRPGDDVRVYFNVNQDAYVIVYDVDTRGYVHLLYPYDFRDSRFVQGNKPYRIPDAGDDYYLKVNGPAGAEKVVVLATKDPFYIPDLGWNMDYDKLSDQDIYFMHKTEGEDVWDFIERLNHKIVPDNVDYQLDVANFQVENPYPKRYYVEPSYYFSYYNYPSWYYPYDYFGAVYFDYPYHASIFIDGIFFGYAPLYLPYFVYGRHFVTIYNQGFLVYRDYCNVRPHDNLRIQVPSNRIYRTYVQRFSRDYRVINDKPDIFWNRVRQSDIRYKASPAIKDDFNFRRTDRDASRQIEKFRVAENSKAKINTENSFREKIQTTRKEELNRAENRVEKNLQPVRTETPEKRLRKEKETNVVDQGRSVRQETPATKEKVFRQQMEKNTPTEPKESKESRIANQNRSIQQESKEKVLRQQKERTQPEQQLQQREPRLERPETNRSGIGNAGRTQNPEKIDRPRESSPPKVSREPASRNTPPSSEGQAPRTGRTEGKGKR